MERFAATLENDLAAVRWSNGQEDRSFIAALTIGVGVVLVLCMIGKRQIKRSRANAAQAAMPAWEQEMEQWNCQFYCGRCDLVFVPNGSNKIWL